VTFQLPQVAIITVTAAPITTVAAQQPQGACDDESAHDRHRDDTVDDGAPDKALIGSTGVKFSATPSSVAIAMMA
jgi:hypothetical protein